MLKWSMSRYLARGLTVVVAATVASVAHGATVTRTVRDGVPVITIAGPALIGDGARFAAVVAASPTNPGTVVDVSGPGGAALDGLRIGLIIHRLGWATRVGDGRSCYSTCAFIWLAGGRRIISSDAHVAFHSIYDGRLNAVTDVGRDMMAIYARELGLNAATRAFVAAKAPGQGFDWIDAAKAKEIGLAMDVVPTSRREAGHFSTAAVDAIEAAAAHERTGGADALYADILACYAACKRQCGETQGFQCFALESAAVVMAEKRAKAEHRRIDRRLSPAAAGHRLAEALLKTGKSLRDIKRTLARWNVDLKTIAVR